MRTNRFAVALAGAMGVIFTIASGPILAETVNCTAITALPATISSGGSYCLTGNLSTSATTGNAITIAANNVTLDLNGFRLAGTGAGTATAAVGIYASQRNSLKIKNGRVKGFEYGIYLADSSPYTTAQENVIEDMLLDSNTYAGIFVQGRMTVIHHNRIVQTGGTTLPALGSNPNAYGIWFDNGLDNRAIDNDISTVTKTGTGTSRGIFVDAGASWAVLVNNRITGSDVGIDCALANPNEPQPKYMRNLTSGVTTPYSPACVDAGNNN